MTVRIEGYVYCLKYGEVHEDSLNPYDMPGDYCDPVDHRPIYWRLRKGDQP